MKTPLKSLLGTCLALATGSLIHAQPLSTPTDEQQAIDLVRGVIQVDRAAAVAEELQLTEAEAEKFWPLYDQYRAEMDKVGDGLVKLVQTYAFYHPIVPEDKAANLLKELVKLEQKQVATRNTWLKKMGKVVPASKTLRFAQVESRLDLALRLELAAAIPLMPVEGRLPRERSAGVAVAAGQPGGAMVETTEITATVIRIDKSSRKFTLLSPEGFKTTVKAGPDVANFNQIRVGDRIKVTATQELVVWLSAPGEAVREGAATAVLLAPIGAKPGGIAAETVQVIGTVTALDAGNRTATLKFEDGTTETFPVRADVDLAKRKVGDKVVFQLTESVAIRVTQP
ncbi:MAG: hypothetical protein KJ072_27385 [Verrucomicrobia bacterium]|nr:hypothetical protein [Verrucomicrobiota bacterium]